MHDSEKSTDILLLTAAGKTRAVKIIWFHPRWLIRPWI